jgi:hypothetical protein
MLAQRNAGLARFTAGFKANNGLSGKITDHYNGYGLFVQGLNIDQLIKLMGAVKQL